MQPTKAECKLTHCEAGKPGGVGKAVFERVVL